MKCSKMQHFTLDYPPDGCKSLSLGILCSEIDHAENWFEKSHWKGLGEKKDEEFGFGERLGLVFAVFLSLFCENRRFFAGNWLQFPGESI